MEKHDSPKEMSQLLGVTVQTLQNGDDSVDERLIESQRIGGMTRIVSRSRSGHFQMEKGKGRL
jgi:hypothetical protein